MTRAEVEAEARKLIADNGRPWVGDTFPTREAAQAYIEANKLPRFVRVAEAPHARSSRCSADCAPNRPSRRSTG